MKIERLTVGLREAAQILGVAPCTLRAAVAKKEVRCVPFGRNIRIPVSELTRLVGPAVAK